MAFIAAATKRHLANTRRIALSCLGTAVAPLLGRRSRRFNPGAISGPLRGVVADELAQIMSGFAEHGEGRTAMAQAVETLRQGLTGGAFNTWLVQEPRARHKQTLCEAADAISGKRWKLQMFFIPDGQSHSPHSHSDVVSALIVARGTIRAREYDRFRRLERCRAHMMLALASDGHLGSGDCLISTPEYRDVHWFGASGGPAVAFNFQAVGFGRGVRPFEPLRIYVDARRILPGAVHQAPKLSRRTARALFACRPLEAFPLPHVSG